MPDFNASQTAAIEAQNQNILVSAAAGSGKTTVMVEKIRQTLIRHPEASISQFLVITFTRDAAQNMKNKLRNLLEEAAGEGSEPASRALSEIETAAISTIHSSCTELLKEYNDNAGASMTPRVLKDTEKKKIFDECFNDVANRAVAPGSACSLPDRKAVSALMTAIPLLKEMPVGAGAECFHPGNGHSVGCVKPADLFRGDPAGRRCDAQAVQYPVKLWFPCFRPGQGSQRIFP